MGNDPLLYIESVRNGNDFNSSNQEVYDSRIKNKKTIARHRLKDLEAMLYFKINILVEVKTKTKYYEGKVISYNEDFLVLKTSNGNININVASIESINILKL